MKIMIGNSDLDFLLHEDSLATSCLPIRVIQSAYRKYDLLTAIPFFRDIPNWRSLKYLKIGEGQGSVFLIDEWRMNLRCEDSNEEQQEITITKIWSDQDELNN